MARKNGPLVVRTPAALPTGVRAQIVAEAEAYTARGRAPNWDRIAARYGCTAACVQACWRQARLVQAHRRLQAQAAGKITLAGIAREAGLKISPEAARRLLAQAGIQVPRPLPRPKGGRDRKEIDPPRPPRPGPRRLTVSVEEIAWWGAGSGGGYQPSKKPGVWMEWPKSDKTTKPKDLPWTIRVRR